MLKFRNLPAALLILIPLFVFSCSKGSNDIVIDDVEDPESFPQFSIKVQHDGKTVYEAEGNKSYVSFYYATESNPYAPCIYPLVCETYTTSTGNTAGRWQITFDDGSFFCLHLALQDYPKNEKYQVIYDKFFYRDYIRPEEVSPFTGTICKLFFWGTTADGQLYTSVQGSHSFSNIRTITENRTYNGQPYTVTGRVFDGKFTVKYKTPEGKEHIISGNFKNMSFYKPIFLN